MLQVLVVASVVVSIFSFLFYRGIWVISARKDRYIAYGNATYDAVREHLGELKQKESSLIVDKGYGQIDYTPWNDELERFSNLIVAKKLPASVYRQLKQTPSLGTEFYTFVVNYTKDLLCYSNLPEKDIWKAVASIEGEKQNRLNPTPMANFKKEKAIRGTVGMVAATFLASMMGFGSDAHAAAEGFAPIDACNVLADEQGFTPTKSGYSELYEGTYSCATLYKTLGSEPLPNNISLYGRGTPSEVSTVRLLLNVNVKANASRDQKYLSTLCVKMVQGLLGSAPEDFGQRVAKGKPFEEGFKGYSLRLEREDWPTGKGFEYNCIVSVAGKEATK